MAGQARLLRLGSVNTAGETDFASAGISWTIRLGDKFYPRPGAGVAVHDGLAGQTSGNLGAFYNSSDRIQFGSRVVFEPELQLGYRFNDRWAIEASHVHLSHAALFGRANAGMADMGVRIVHRFGP